jgi:flagellar motor switch protein FliN/FliY
VIASDLLMHVPMRVSAELGAREMLVSEVLKLGIGTVIELNRPAGTPIDLLVNNQLVARGDVVAVDDKFGVRITELLQKTV